MLSSWNKLKYLFKWCGKGSINIQGEVGCLTSIREGSIAAAERTNSKTATKSKVVDHCWATAWNGQRCAQGELLKCNWWQAGNAEGRACASRELKGFSRVWSCHCGIDLDSNCLRLPKLQRCVKCPRVSVATSAGYKCECDCSRTAEGGRQVKL